jgi:hypothetical protein
VEVVRQPHKFDTANAHIAEGLIWASLCATVLKRFLAHAAQRDEIDREASEDERLAGTVADGRGC